MDALLCEYATSPTAASGLSVMAPKAPLMHYTMLDDEECGCAVCDEWRLRRAELDAAMKIVPEGHRWSICACSDCRFVGRIHLNAVAASNVRDLLIEVAFHANWHSRHGQAVMDWFARELRSPRYTTRWCAYEIGRRPVGEWLAECEKALSPVLSGTVFKRGEGHHYEVDAWQPSQLGAAMASTSSMITA